MHLMFRTDVGAWLPALARYTRSRTLMFHIPLIQRKFCPRWLFIFVYTEGYMPPTGMITMFTTNEIYRTFTK